MTPFYKLVDFNIFNHSSNITFFGQHWALSPRPGHSKSTFAWNFQFLTNAIPLVYPCSFYTYAPPPHHSTYFCFSELPPPLQKKFSRRLWIFEWKIEKWKEREQFSFFCKINIKNQCFSYSYICNDNKNIYKFIKKH